MSINVQKSFDYGVEEAVHEPKMYNIINTFDYDIPLWKKHAQSVNGPVLELGCGTGRITLPLAAAGIDITGFDMSKMMLNDLQGQLTKANIVIPLHEGDMRNFNLNKKFSLVFIPFNTLQCIYKLEDIEAIFRNVRRHLLPNGKFIIDIFNPSISIIYERSLEFFVICDKLRLPDGNECRWLEKIQYDTDVQIVRTTWKFELEGSENFYQKLDMRCFFPQEIDALLKYNGFTIQNKYGNFDESPFVSNSPKQIIVCS